MAKCIDELKNKLKTMKQESWSVKAELLQFLQNHDIEYKEDIELSNMHFDVYLEHYNVAITLLSVNSDSEQDYINKGYALYDVKRLQHKKALKCKECNLRHVFIWDYMWDNDRQQSILKSLLLNCCHKSTTVYARNTYIKVCRAYDVREFFYQNNLGGYRVAKDAICLFDKKTHELLMSYALGHAYYGKGSYDLEVTRGACKQGYNIIGGASKLWKYIVEQYAPDKSIVYYVDLNQYNGNSLEKLREQFPKMQYVKAKYSFKNWFVEEQVMRNRNPMQHRQLVGLTQEGLVKTCWDAGSLVYVYDKDFTK